MWWQAAKEIWKIWPGGIANGRKASSCTATVSTDGMMTKRRKKVLESSRRLESRIICPPYSFASLSQNKKPRHVKASSSWLEAHTNFTYAIKARKSSKVLL
ncbi:hypothetical protein RUM44_009815 [Polyplax serrata]|uniref:Uncharacterized protein n=1 Tax=Polyplax serrata TaxID=468196 RepID=A0ABR1AV92_POLSC